MNTDVQRTHKIIVGAGVALIAAAGISTVALNVHRVVSARSAAAAPPVALPDTSAPQLNNQAPQAAPPPIADSPVSTPPAENSAAPAETAPAQSSAQPSTAPAKNPPRASATESRRGASASGAGPSVASSGLKTVATGETAVVTTSRKLDSNQAAAATAPTSEGMLAGGVSATSNGAASTPDQNAATGAAANPDAPTRPAPVAGNDDVSTTMQAKAAGADTASSDRMITDAVQSQLEADTAGQGAALSVNTINGVVILSGTVPNADIVEHAKQVAQQVRGVKGVDTAAVKLSGS